MASKFPPFLASAKKDPIVLPFKPDAGETFLPLALVFYDTATDTLKLCGADPALILGIALGSAASKTITPDSHIPVQVLDPDVIIGLSSPTTPAQSHVGDSFGILMDATTKYWQADPTDAGNARVVCVGINISLGIFYVRFLAANLQGDAIAS